MSRRHRTDDERHALRVTCEFCEARPGDWCRSHLRPRNVAQHMHRVRFELADYSRRDKLALLLELAQNDERLARAIEEATR